jgi:hypothetical protein
MNKYEVKFNWKPYKPDSICSVTMRVPFVPRLGETVMIDVTIDNEEVCMDGRVKEIVNRYTNKTDCYIEVVIE